jgi:RHS repeat-associated protein
VYGIRFENWRFKSYTINFAVRDRSGSVTPPADGTITAGAPVDEQDRAATVVEYDYTGDGNRYSETKTVEGTVPQTVEYLWDPNSSLLLLAAQTDPATGAADIYTYGLGLLSQQSDGFRSFYHRDRMGSVAAITDAAGEPVAATSYDAFGQIRSNDQSESAPSNPMRFTGALYDSDTGLYHLNARQYDPATGRFLQTDPLDRPMTEPGTSKYTYVNNQPTTMIDPSGLYHVKECGPPKYGNFVERYSWCRTSQDPVVRFFADPFIGAVNCVANVDDTRSRGSDCAWLLLDVGTAGIGKFGKIAKSIPQWLRRGDNVADFARFARWADNTADALGPVPDIARRIDDVPGVARHVDEFSALGTFGKASKKLDNSATATSAARGADDAFDAGGARFVVDSRGTATDLGPRMSPDRPVVIGEDMAGRVRPAAADFAADAYRPPVLWSDRASMAHNRYWVNEQMNQGRGVIDVGPAPGRTNFPEPTSPWYIMEREQIAQRNYPYYVQRQR